MRPMNSARVLASRRNVPVMFEVTIVASLELVQPTLDDVFVAKTGHHIVPSASSAPADD